MEYVAIYSLELPLLTLTSAVEVPPTRLWHHNFAVSVHHILWLRCFLKTCWHLWGVSRCSSWSWARVGGFSAAMSMNSWRRGSSLWPGRPDSALYGLCRRKCRSRRLHSSWLAPLSTSLTPNSLLLVRAAPCCRTRTGGECLRFWAVLSVWKPHFHLCTTNFCLSLRRYYEYMFDSAKRPGLKKSRRAGPSELTELQVWITSPDSDCDAYPSVASDESCESLKLMCTSAPPHLSYFKISRTNTS